VSLTGQARPPDPLPLRVFLQNSQCPLAMASGLPLKRAGLIHRAPGGARQSMIFRASRRNAPHRQTAADNFCQKQLMSRRDAKQLLCAHRAQNGRPVMTSSKINSRAVVLRDLAQKIRDRPGFGEDKVPRVCRARVSTMISRQSVPDSPPRAAFTESTSL